MTVWPNLFRRNLRSLGSENVPGNAEDCLEGWPFNKDKDTFFLRPSKFLIAVPKKMKSVPAGILTWDLLHIREGLRKSVAPVWQVSCRPSACSFYGTTPFRMTCCLPNCITFSRLCSGIPSLANGCRNLIRHIRGTLLTPDPWLVCVDKVAPHTQLWAH